MAEHFVEKNRRSSSRQHRRPHTRLVQRRFHQALHFFCQRSARRSHSLITGRIFRVHPVEIVVALDIHSIRCLALDEKFQPVMDLPALQLRPLCIHQVRILRERRKRHDRIQNRRRFPELFRIRPHSFFPWLPVQRERHFRLDRLVRLLVRKIRRVAFRRIRFHFLARPDFDQRFRRRAILTICFQPNSPPHNFRIIIDGNSRAGTAAWHSLFPHFVRVVQRVRSRSNRNLQPAVPRFTARKQRSIRTGNFRALRVRDGIADKICFGVLRAQRGKRAVQLRFHRRQQRRRLYRCIRRGCR